MIIISPHIDDSILSLGGLINERKEQKEKIKVINVFSITNYSLLDYKNIEWITALRKYEESEIQKILNHEVINMDYLDNCIRNKIDIFKLKDDIEKHLDRKEEIYFPLAINNCHKDHKICYDISIMLNGYNICYYEDMPYVIKYIDHLPKDRKEIIYEIDINKKLDLLRLYQSQLTNEMLKKYKGIFILYVR